MGRVVKRLVDVVLAAVALVLLAPVWLLAAAAIYAAMGSPVLFRQVRPGRGERPFELLKFRTMREATGADGKPLADGARLTPLGRFLREASLDELPTLWNVIRGDMSLVGPRPLLMRYLPYFTDRERLRFTVPPGITGLAQIRGRNTIGWTERLESDVEYVERWSLALDAEILVRTVGQVIRGHGAIADANTIMDDLDVERSANRAPAR